MCLQTHWGTHSLTVAIRALLEFALEDTLNQRFVLLSESDVPLYPATVFWLQLMAEPDSRIRACPGPLVRLPVGSCMRWQSKQLCRRMSHACMLCNPAERVQAGALGRRHPEEHYGTSPLAPLGHLVRPDAPPRRDHCW